MTTFHEEPYPTSATPMVYKPPFVRTQYAVIDGLGVFEFETEVNRMAEKGYVVSPGSSISSVVLGDRVRYAVMMERKVTMSWDPVAGVYVPLYSGR